MKRPLKWLLIFMGGVAGLVILLGLGFYSLGWYRLNRTRSIDPKPVVLPTDPDSLLEGQRIFRYRGCEACHGEDLSGLVYLDNPAIGQVITPNLTEGAGGIGGERSDLDLVRAIRHGLDPDGKPRWTENFEQRKPVFTDPGHCYRPEVVFNPGIRKYLLLTATSGAPRWCGTDEKYLGVFESSTPWGPWRTVKQIHGWGGEENRFQPRIPPKWISKDGKTFYLLYSCFPEGPYQFNVQKCVLEMSEQ